MHAHATRNAFSFFLPFFFFFTFFLFFYIFKLRLHSPVFRFSTTPLSCPTVKITRVIAVVQVEFQRHLFETNVDSLLLTI